MCAASNVIAKLYKYDRVLTEVKIRAANAYKSGNSSQMNKYINIAHRILDAMSVYYKEYVDGEISKEMEREK